MKLLVLAALFTAVLAQPKPRQNLFVEFKSCTNSPCAGGTECCNFDDNQGQKVKFCMTTKQKNGKWTGSYTDDDQTDWEWTCKVPPAKGAGGGATKAKMWDTK